MIDYLELLDEDVNPDDIDVSSIKFHSYLNPDIWVKTNGEYSLREDVKSKLLVIADKFSDFIRYKGDKIEVNDIELTGSNCNYNYTETSDLDMHFRVDYSTIADNYDLVSQYLYDKKILWTLKYDVKVNSIPVECYVADVSDERVKGAAYYSLLNNKWIVKPDRKNIVVDLSAVKDKAAELMDLVEKADTKEQLEKIQEKLWRMRYAGLHTAGEFSTETLAYKILRNNGTLAKIKERISSMDRF